MTISLDKCEIDLILTIRDWRARSNFRVGYPEAAARIASRTPQQYIKESDFAAAGVRAMHDGRDVNQAVRSRLYRDDEDLRL
jgi:hypothetical protein